MKFYKEIFICVFAIAVLVSTESVLSQVVVQRSSDRIVIAGVTYYIHVVNKGETAYSISKAYGITQEELVKENPAVVYGLKEGQSLRIPENLVTIPATTQEAPTQKSQRDNTRFIYHKLQSGETIYSLSKKYSVSENDIVQSNPGIDINKLPLGYEIAIPHKELMNEKQSFSSQKSQAYYHKVSKGETMSSIARQYGITVRELRRENRDIRFPQVGDYLIIPGYKAPETKPVEIIITDSIPEVDEEKVVYLPKPSGFTPVSNLHGSFNVAVLLPFYLLENAKRTDIDSSKSIKGKKVYKEINRGDDWIYPRSLGFVEMYEGILLAADTLRSLGLNIQMHTFDVSGDTTELRKLIVSGKLDGMDLIIGPVHSHNLSLLARWAGKSGIPVVSPVELSNNSALESNPLLFMASASIEVAQNALARKMAEYYTSNFVFIHSDPSGEPDDMTARFRNKILGEISLKMPFEEIRFKDMTFYSRSVFGNDSIDRLAHTLVERTKNVILIASDDAPVMSESLTDIHALSRRFDMTVFGYPNMRYLDNFDQKVCFDLGLTIYSPYWIDYNQKDVKEFNSDFRAKFLTEPSEISYAWQGYDIMYYFISGLAINGKQFLSHPEIHNPDLLHTEFDFRRKTNNDGFENEKLYLIKYSNSYELELLKEDMAGVAPQSQ